jgi:enoyl-[acyl-carrier-protein] reductase (NADH)
MTIREAETKLKQLVPQAKLTSVDKIANLVAFLVSQLGAGVSGQTVSASEALNSLTA